MFKTFKEERNIRKALRLIANQRAVISLVPGNVFVIQNSPADLGWFRVAVTTAQFRGWAEVLFDAIPRDRLKWQGDELVSPTPADLKPHYRLTEGGWAVLNRVQTWTVATFVVSAAGLVATVISVIVGWPTR